MTDACDPPAQSEDVAAHAADACDPPAQSEDVAPQGTGSDTTALTALRNRITSCTACQRLVTWREAAADHPPAAFEGQRYWCRPLPGFGDVDGRLVLVGLAPAAHGGNRTGRMFTGDRSGDFLFAGLWRAGFASQAESRSRDDGLALRDAFVTAAVRCAPPDNKPTPAERDRCRPYLAEELAMLDNAAVYLALGAFAYDALSRTAPVAEALARPRPRFAHGAEIRLSGPLEGRSLLCSYHPSQRNVFTGLLTAAMFDTVMTRATQLIAETPRTGLRRF